MNPTHKAFITLDDGTEVHGQVMYLIVWEGKSLSGHEVLVSGDRITSVEVSSVDDE